MEGRGGVFRLTLMPLGGWLCESETRRVARRRINSLRADFGEFLQSYTLRGGRNPPLNRVPVRPNDVRSDDAGRQLAKPPPPPAPGGCTARVDGDQAPGYFGKRCPDLLSGPSRGGMLADVEVNQAAPTVRQHRQHARTRKVAEGTVKKSMETRSPTWLSRKVFQV